MLLKFFYVVLVEKMNLHEKGFKAILRTLEKYTCMR